MKHKIGVFDSGVGGLSVANAVKKSFPEYDILLKEDKANLPYGNKTPAQLLGLVTPILQSMVREEGCAVIVIACNTVTTTIIEDLRQVIDVPLIGIEPMIKPASLMTKSGVIGVFATPTTLGSKRYNELKKSYAKNMKVVEPDCSSWSFLIENNRENELDIGNTVNEILSADADVLVLACTHYHWIEKEIKLAANGRAIILQPEQAIIKRLKSVLQQL